VSLTGGLLACGAATAGWLGLRLTADRLIFPRSHSFRAEKEASGRDAEDVWFCAEDGAELHGWWFPHSEAKGGVLVCHGNAGNVSDRVWIPRDLSDVPLHVFVFDYRGYGQSRGRPSERGTEMDVSAAWETARMRVGGGEDPPIVLYGRSLGGAVALQAAAKLPVRGVVLESTFTSILELALLRYWWLLPRVACRHPYRSDLRISRVRAPVLAAHSPEDEVVPYEMGKRLFRRAPNPWGFEGLSGTHVEAGWQTSPAYAEAFRAFVNEVV